MEQLKTNLAELIKVKTIVTLVVIIVFAVMALTGQIPPDSVMVVVSTVLAFYFGTQHEKNAPAAQIQSAAEPAPEQGDNYKTIGGFRDAGEPPDEMTAE